MSTKGMLSRVWEFPLPSSLVQTISVLSSRLPPPPGLGVLAETLGEIGKLLTEPFVDLRQLLHRLFLAAPGRVTARDAPR